VNQFGGMSLIDLGAKLLHKHIKRIVLDGIPVTPYRVDDVVPPKHRAWIAHHELQDEELG
jgi:hypothetical protein